MRAEKDYNFIDAVVETLRPRARRLVDSVREIDYRKANDFIYDAEPLRRIDPRRIILRKAMVDTEFFKEIVRPALYWLYNGDFEIIHDVSLDYLKKFPFVAEELAPLFDSPNLHIRVDGKSVMPFGNAEGFDKNAVAIRSLSNLFGIVMFGTVPVNQRKGNSKPRIETDEIQKTIYNALGFPTEGLDRVVRNARQYKRHEANAVLLGSICGIPDEKGIETAYRELEKLATELAPYVDGFIWNPASPNTYSLPLLRKYDVAKRSAEIISKNSKGKLLVKIPPYENDVCRQETLSFVKGFLDGGGNGVVAVNTLKTSYQIGENKFSGLSGSNLGRFRQKAIKDIREEFGKDIFLIAEGGIIEESGEQAFNAFGAGANAIAGYTGMVFNGFGVIPQMARGLERMLNKKGYKTLTEFQESIGLKAA